ncbi:MAG: NAD(P)H-hydrate dehydratase, partial [Candidatus Methanomethylicia archaeon]
IGGRNRLFIILAGTGNNGGDALVTARRIYSSGGYVEVFIVGDPSKYPEPARKNYEIIKSIEIPINIIQDEKDLTKLKVEIGRCDAIVAGLIGIGLKGEVKGVMRKVIELINDSNKTVISVDIPSGINGDNGQIHGVAVRSNYTVTFGLPKYGNILYPGYHYCGKLYISKLSYPTKLLDSDEISVELNFPIQIPERIRWGHKGNFGKLLTIAGAKYYYGAPYYVSYAFLKAGGGYSGLATPRSVAPYIAAKCSEIVYIPLEETSEGSIARNNYEKIMRLIDEYDIDIVAIGPGTSLNQETQELILNLIETINKPVIIDGDGITAASKNVNIIKNRRTPTIITPHLGEFSRMTGLKMNEILENPINILKGVCGELNSYIILKGAHSLIGYPNHQIYINMTGNPGMAKAGSGDVLTGTIAAMYGIGLKDVGEAARMGVLIHGLAGDLAAEELGEDGVTPDNILNNIPKAIRILREKQEYIYEKYMPKEI